MYEQVNETQIRMPLMSFHGLPFHPLRRIIACKSKHLRSGTLLKISEVLKRFRSID